MNKSEVIEYLKTMPESEVISYLINKITNIGDEEFNELLIKKGIKSFEDIEEFVSNEINNVKENNIRNYGGFTNRFENLNELLSYGVTDKTLHIHLVPEDARKLLTKDGLKKFELNLIDALQKINVLLQQEEKRDIQSIYAVSGIMKGPIARIFKNLEFDVIVERSERAKDNPELSKFYELFKNKKDIGRAVTKREKLMSEEYQEMLSERQNELSEELKTVYDSDFFSKLKDEKYSENEVLQNEQKRTQENKNVKGPIEQNIKS